jgi:hypothetical protein
MWIRFICCAGLYISDYSASINFTVKMIKDLFLLFLLRRIYSPLPFTYNEQALPAC